MKSQRRHQADAHDEAIPKTRPSRRSRILRNAAALVITLLVLLLLFQNQGSVLSASATDRLWTTRVKLREIPVVYGYEVVNRFPHDPSAFTQGFQFEQICSERNTEHCKDIFLESTGIYGESSVRRSVIESGDIVNMTALDKRHFGEGLTLFGDRIYQLTWRTPTVLIYGKNLSKIEQKDTPLRDGWGLTTDETHLIMTDSGSNLYWIDIETFELRRQLTVTDGGREVKKLNELEYIDGMIWANVWYKDCIAIIEPEKGQVQGWVLLQGLRKKAAEITGTSLKAIDVLNGIAYDANKDRLFVTGKLWPLVFEIKITPMMSSNQEELENIRRLCIP